MSVDVGVGVFFSVGFRWCVYVCMCLFVCSVRVHDSHAWVGLHACVGKWRWKHAPFSMAVKQDKIQLAPIEAVPACRAVKLLRPSPQL
jgi:hypothetical protein